MGENSGETSGRRGLPGGSRFTWFPPLPWALAVHFRSRLECTPARRSGGVGGPNVADCPRRFPPRAVGRDQVMADLLAARPDQPHGWGVARAAAATAPPRSPVPGWRLPSSGLVAARAARLVPFSARPEPAELPSVRPTLMAGARDPLCSHGLRRAAVRRSGVAPFPGVPARAAYGRRLQHPHRHSLAVGGTSTAPAPPAPVLDTTGGAAATSALHPPPALASWVVSPARQAAARRCLPRPMVTWAAVAAGAHVGGPAAGRVAGGGQACAWRPPWG